MIITLKQDDIENALINYVNSLLGAPVNPENTSISITAGRGVNGHSAEIEIAAPKAVNTKRVPVTYNHAAEVPIKEEVTTVMDSVEETPEVEEEVTPSRNLFSAD